MGIWRARAKKVWDFLWHDESIYSWLANIVIAFILIKFAVYPLISLMLGTPLPVVAVVSGSMEHRFAPQCDRYLASGLCLRYSDARFDLCGTTITELRPIGIDGFWQYCGGWYDQRNISKDRFEGFSFSQGFNTGDVMIVRGRDWEDLRVGDVIVWFARDGTPIIHRVVAITETDGERRVQTKGDHNVDQITVGLRAETAITEEQYIGVAVARIPWLGNIKLYAVRGLGWLASIF